MYILSGKGSVAGADLAAYIVRKCQEKGVLWDDDLPEYTLDFLTQTPSVSKSIREGKAGDVVAVFNRKLKWAQANHRSYMLLCLTAHKLIPQLETSLECVNLWDAVADRFGDAGTQFAFLGTHECLPSPAGRFVTLPRHVERIGDLITSLKRGHARRGERYAAHPKHLLEKIVAFYREQDITKFFLACTDLHACKQYLTELGVNEDDIVDILEVAGDEVIRKKGRAYTESFLDSVSDGLTHLRYKYLSESDSPRTDEKTRYLHALLEDLPTIEATSIKILDIGGGSSGHSIALAERLAPRACAVTVQDISQAALDAAKPLYQHAPNVITKFVCGDIAEFNDDEKFDFILCLGVLLYVSNDESFARTAMNISGLLKPGGFLVTRDCLSDAGDKIYMEFGGVIRSEAGYRSAFRAAGCEVFKENAFVIERPIRRTIRTMIWKKRTSPEPK